MRTPCNCSCYDIQFLRMPDGTRMDNPNMKQPMAKPISALTLT